MPTIELRHQCCMEYMAGLPDKAFDLAIVDPPYGIGGGSYGSSTGVASKRYGKVFQRTIDRLSKDDYDTGRPSPEYFEELRRVSHDQIIWGGNHFADLLPASASWVVWDKCVSEKLTLSDCELAWCSIGGSVRKYTQTWAGFWRKGEMQSYGHPKRPEFDKIHPTQKPIAIYLWLLKNYAKPGQRILDTHLGSGSIAIACDIEGFDLVGCEIDADYIAGARKRFADHKAQPRLFTSEPPPEPVQISIEPAA